MKRGIAVNKIEQFADMVRRSERIVFFGGAGVSTESGIKDYRSPDGMYQTVKAYEVSPETILSREFFNEHPEVFYRFHYEYFLNVTAAENRTHKALAELERQGKLSAVITQNIDGLHQAAGSEHVIELHGTVSLHYCTQCRELMDTADVKALRGAVPHCRECGGIVRPDVVLYGEPLPQAAIHEALDEIAAADLLIVGGTSLVVYPAAGLLRYFGGDRMVIINRDETPFDTQASLVFHDSIGDVMEQMMQVLK